MFEEVRIQGVGVIDDAVLELSPGLNVVTGETGAGKTMVVSGLGLLLGMRADAGLVRAGRRSAVVEGVVQRPGGARGADPGRGGGRGRERGPPARADGGGGRALARARRRSEHSGRASSPRSARRLVAVHGQADQWRLRQGDQHREVLDRFGGEPVTAALRAYRGDLRRPLHARVPSVTGCGSWPTSAPERSTCSRPASNASRRSTRSPARTSPSAPRTSGSPMRTACGWRRRRPTPTSSATTGMRRTPPHRWPTPCPPRGPRCLR